MFQISGRNSTGNEKRILNEVNIHQKLSTPGHPNVVKVMQGKLNRGTLGWRGEAMRTHLRPPPYLSEIGMCFGLEEEDRDRRSRAKF